MAKNRDSRNNRDGDDERLGRSGTGSSADENIGGLEPMIPVGAQFEEEENPDLMAHATGDHAYARDSDRALDEREHGEREVTDAERLERFRLAMFQNQLPALPKMEGWHLCWLTTSNPRDSVQGRLRLGYELVKPEEVPGWEANIVAAGPYSGCIGINEMVAARLPMRLYELYMTEAHHNQPLAEEGRLKSTLDAVRDLQGKGTKITLEEGMAALARPRKAHFEEIHGPRRTVPAGG
jgi:hypothetical protein